MLFDDNYQASKINTQAQCSTGSISTVESEKVRMVEVIYNHCVIEGSQFNGSVKKKAFSAITSALPAVNIVTDIEFGPVGSDEKMAIGSDKR